VELLPVFKVLLLTNFATACGPLLFLTTTKPKAFAALMAMASRYLGEKSAKV
jgi:hypothetical protein